MNTTENNQLIDTFMGSKGKYISYKDVYGGEVWGEYKPHNYHSDWRELIPVIHKIKDLKKGFDCKIVENFENFEKVLCLPIYTKIEIVYNACLEFIKWYNQQTD